LIAIFSVGSKKGYITIQSKERIVLMDTISPASTNGDNTFMLQDPDRILLLTLPADMISYLDGESGKFYSETVNLEYDKVSKTLTHASATAAYAVYRAQKQMRSEMIAPFNRWVQYALRAVQAQLEQEGSTSVQTTA